MKRCWFILLAVAVALSARQAIADVTIFSDGRSAFTIVRPADAPKTLIAAAEELQRDLALAGGAKLRIIKDDAKASGPIISLGMTREARAAGLNTDGLGNGGYRIVTKDGNLYIVGPDTLDGKWTKAGGISSGTANGVYNFLKDRMGARWLMPGDIGRVVPIRKTLELPDLSLSYTPLFSDRGLSVVRTWPDRRHRPSDGEDWLDRQGVGGNNEDANVEHNHNWWRTLNRSADPNPEANGSSLPDTPAVKAIYEKHPDWFAMDADGKRPFPKNHYSKLESTNPELIAWFARQAIRTLKASSRPRTFSLSPSDGSGWSQSPQSKALYDPPPPFRHGQPGVSSLVLKWYHDVAQIVAADYPQGRLSGYIYASYFDPPTKYPAKLPPNFTPVIAASISYGYGMYRPDVRQNFQAVLEGWSKIITGGWYYYDLPSQVLRQSRAEMGLSNFAGGVGLIMPVAPENLDIIFHTLVATHASGTKHIYGVQDWSSAAINNAVLAGMIWNPKANAVDLRNDWLDHAYGKEAGAIMAQLYDRLNVWYRDYYRANPDIRYELTKDMLKEIYGKHYGQIESLYLRAMEQPITGPQKRRLQLIGDNLVVLQWRLRNCGFLPADAGAKLEADSAKVNALLRNDTRDFALFPGVLQGSLSGDTRGAFRRVAAQYKDVSVRVAPANSPSAAGSAAVMDDNVLMFHATRDTKVRINPKMVEHDFAFATYVVCPNYEDLAYPDQQTRIAEGLLDPTLPITFSMKAGATRYMYIPPRRTRYRLEIEHAAVAKADLDGKVLTLRGGASPLLVYHYTSSKGKMDVSQEGDAVMVANPSSNSAARHYLREKFKSGRIDRNLDAGWRFSPDPGNDALARGVTGPDFNDSNWKTITTTNWWQMQGFTDYHGPAWYRIQFAAPTLKAGETARIFFGAIDGNATVYFNKQEVGQHLLGDNFAGWDKPFSFDVTKLLDSKLNTLAVRVVSKDDTSASGIFKGVCLISGIPR